MITKFKLFESKISPVKNPVSWEGKPFWIGIFDALDGEIIDTWTYETAESNDFHHSFYMAIPYLDKISNDEYIVFWFNFDKKGLDGWDNLTPFIKKRIYNQLDN